MTPATAANHAGARISVLALLDGTRVPLDDGPAMAAWFADARSARADVRYAAVLEGEEHRVHADPATPSDLVRAILDSIPGTLRPDHIGWTLLDDFTRSHCVSLALRLAATRGVRPCATFDIDEYGERTFAHAGARLPDGSVLCAYGRSEPARWTQLQREVSDPEVEDLDVDQAWSFAQDDPSAADAGIDAVADLVWRLTCPEVAADPRAAPAATPPARSIRTDLRLGVRPPTPALPADRGRATMRPSGNVRRAVRA